MFPLGVPLRFASGRHLTGFATLMASPPLRGPPGGSRKNLLTEAKSREVGLFVYRDPSPNLPITKIFAVGTGRDLSPFW
jgi:hypothetical protein